MTLALFLELCGAASLATVTAAYAMWEWRRKHGFAQE
jgi:hypothetical protein